jgi:2-polyprenyl-6-methoxyphenol hydroxylase-like FAD-dependent oxidoreductase
VNKPEAWALSIPFEDARAGLLELAKEFADFAPHLVAFITDSDARPVLRPICALPVGHRWNRVPGITLIGDAAHLMSPFAGVGANLALYDGAALAKALLAHPSDLEAALAEFEAALFARSSDFAKSSAENLERFFSNDAPGSVVDIFKGH